MKNTSQPASGPGDAVPLNASGALPGCLNAPSTGGGLSLAWILALTLLVLFGALFSFPARSQTFTKAQVELFQAVREQPNDLARYDYLAKRAGQLSGRDNLFAMQLLAFSENELGLYSEAIRDFPLTSHPVTEIKIPDPKSWEAKSAVAEVSKLAVSAQIVLLNEAHHDAHARELSLLLLPKLYRHGYRYFAAEALIEDGGDIRRHGYVSPASGSEYVREPLYGELIRVALSLGYNVVAYDVTGAATPAEREKLQAKNLFDKILVRDPRAKIFVHAGYAHIDKAPGRLGPTKPMAMLLEELSGAKMISVDQTQFREQIPAVDARYNVLLKDFNPTEPIVIKNKAKGDFWSAAPNLYDLNVLLPQTTGAALRSGTVERSTIVTDTNRALPVLSHVANAERPAWLNLKGLRSRYVIRSSMCKTHFPCLVEARYLAEGSDAIPADRYVFRHDDSRTVLYLRPGSYALSVSDVEGKSLSTSQIKVNP